MATRYWVGGAGTWDTVTATNWSATSGGAGGASVPTSADAVIIDASSGTGSIYSISSVCATLTYSNSNITFDSLFSPNGSISISGNISCTAAITTTNVALSMIGTTAGRTISIASGSSINQFLIAPTGAGTYALASALSGVEILAVYGTFSTAGFALTCQSIYLYSGALTLGASTITITVSSLILVGGTLTANTSTIIGNIYNSTASTTYTVNKISGACAIVGDSLIVIGAASTVTTASFTGKISASSTITCSGDSYFNITTGTMTGAVTFNAGGSINNAGATFGAVNFNSAPYSYAYHINGYGTFGAVTFNSAGVHAATIVLGPGNVSSFGAVNATNAQSFSYDATATDSTTTFSSTITFPNSASNSFTANGTYRTTVTGVATMPQPVAITGLITFTAAVTFTGGANVNGTVTFSAVPVFVASTTATITGGLFTTATAFAIAADAVFTSCTFTPVTTFNGTASIASCTFTGASTFNGHLTSSGNTFTGASTVAAAALGAEYSGTNTFTTLTLTPLATGANVYTFDPAGSYTVSTSLVASGTSGINRVRIASTTVGTPATISAAATTLTDVDFADITKAGAAGWTGTRIGNAGGNTGITFTTAKDVYLVGTIGYNVTAGFSLTSGGAVATTNIALPQDTLYVNNSSGNSGVTVTFNANGHIYPAIDMSTRSVPLTVSTGTVDVNVFGSLILNAAITLSGATTFYLMARSASSLTAAGVTFTQSIAIIGTGTYTLNNTFITTGPLGLALTRGGLNLSTFALTAFSFSQATGSTLTYNTQNIVTLTGYGTGILSITGGTRTGTGTLTFNTTNTGSSSTTMSVTATEATAPNVNVTAGTYSLGMSGSYNTVTFTGFSGSISATGSATIYGNYTVSSGMSFTAATTTITFAGTSGTKVITTNGKAFNRDITFNGAGAVFLLVGSMSTGASLGRTLTLTAGSVGFGGYAVTCALFSSSGTGVRTLAFEGSTLTVIGSGATAFNTGTNTNLTVSGTGIISMTSASAKTFAGGGTVFTAALNQGGTGALTITGSNTLYNITNTVQPTSVLFTPSTTTTFIEDFDLNGTSGNLVTVGTVGSTGTFTVSKSIGTIGVNFLSLSRSTATGGAVWYAGGNSTNGGNNNGWTFATFAGNTSGFFAFF